MRTDIPQVNFVTITFYRSDGTAIISPQILVKTFSDSFLGWKLPLVIWIQYLKFQFSKCLQHQLVVKILSYKIHLSMMSIETDSKNLNSPKIWLVTKKSTIFEHHHKTPMRLSQSNKLWRWSFWPNFMVIG